MSIYVCTVFLKKISGNTSRLACSVTHVIDSFALSTEVYTTTYCTQAGVYVP
jgi:hypothetical protein